MRAPLALTSNAKFFVKPQPSCPERPAPDSVVLLRSSDRMPEPLSARPSISPLVLTRAGLTWTTSGVRDDDGAGAGFTTNGLAAGAAATTTGLAESVATTFFAGTVFGAGAGFCGAAGVVVARGS